MKVLVVYFSPTRNTAEIGEKIGEALSSEGVDVLTRDITSFNDRKDPIDMDNYDAAMFGFPIYVNRAPAIMREWLASLDGKGKKCATFFTYGGVMSHPAHRSTREILEGKNFEVVSSAEFVGSHTYNRVGWDAAMGRPNEKDFEVAAEFAKKTLKRFTGEDTGRPEEFPEGAPYEVLDKMEQGMMGAIQERPSRKGAECSMCMDCEELCPTSAMDATSGEADKEKCILCLRCVDVCPDNVLEMGDLSAMFKGALERTSQTKEDLAKKSSRIYL